MARAADKPWTGLANILTWREVTWASLALVSAVVAYHGCQTPEPARTGLELAAAVCEGSVSERLWLIENRIAARLEVEGSEFGSQSLTRVELPRALQQLRATWGTCRLELTDWQTRAASSGGMWLEGNLARSDSQPSDLHARRRRLRALFRDPEGKNGGPWLERVVVEPASREAPEARP